MSGGKRPITVVDETPEASSVSGDSATTDSSVPPRFRRSRNLGGKMIGEGPDAPQGIG